MNNDIEKSWKNGSERWICQCSHIPIAYFAGNYDQAEETKREQYGNGDLRHYYELPVLPEIKIAVS